MKIKVCLLETKVKKAKMARSISPPSDTPRRIGSRMYFRFVREVSKWDLSPSRCHLLSQLKDRRSAPFRPAIGQSSETYAWKCSLIHRTLLPRHLLRRKAVALRNGVCL